MGVQIQNDEAVLSVWETMMEENRDVFDSDMERTFLAMKIGVQCIDLSVREGLLAVEEFADDECGIGKENIPLWEYFRPVVWIVVQVAWGDMLEKVRWMLYSLMESYHYKGSQAVQGFVYMVCGIVIAEGGSAESAQAFFRSLVPESQRDAFDECFLSGGHAHDY